MQWENDGWVILSAGSAVLAGGAALAGLIFVWRQVRWAKKAIQANAVQNLGAQILQIGQWLADHPEHRNSLYLEEDVDSRHAESVATVAVDFISHVLSQEANMPDDQLEAWKRYFRDQLIERPQVRKVLKKRHNWYGKAMRELREEYAQSSGDGEVSAPSPVTRPQTDESIRGGTRQNPFPIGHPVHNQEWRVRLDEPHEAGDIVAANDCNNPPEAGMEYWIVPVTATYTGDETGELLSIAVKFVGSDNRTYDRKYGAAIPDPLYEVSALYKDGTAKGSVCVAVPAGAHGLWTVSMSSNRPIFFRSEAIGRAELAPESR